MSTYRTRTELETYFVENGSIVYPFIYSGENWILSAVHNRPHEYLAENSDILKDRLDKMAGKAGLSSSQQKLDGIPFWQNTYYISTGQTMTQALSVLDEQVKFLELLFAQLLSVRGETYVGENVANQWVISSSAPYVLVDSGSLTDKDPHPMHLVDCGGFLFLLKKNNFWTSTSMESAKWGTYGTNISTIFGTAYSFEAITDSIVTLTDSNQFNLFASYGNEVENPDAGSPIYYNYIKKSGGSISYEDNRLLFDAEGTTEPPKWVMDINQDLNPIHYMTSLRTATQGYLYIVTSQVTGDLFSLPRADRLISTLDIVYYNYPLADFTLRERHEGLYIEGVTYLSYFSITTVSSTRFGMVLTDQNGDLLYRESSDGINWLIPTTDDLNPGVIIKDSAITDIDFPTLVPAQTDGIIVAYNVNYANGALDDIHYAFSRDVGKTWTIPLFPLESLGVEGVFPLLQRRRNGNIFLLFHKTNTIEAVKLFINIRKDLGD